MLPRLILLFAGMVFGTAAFAQNIIPNGFSFQSIARDANGSIAPNRTVFIQAEIIRGTSSPVSVYTETHHAITSSDGIFTIVIGNGNQATSSFSAIKWSDASYSLNIKIAVSPVVPPINWRYQDALIDAGTVQLLSVPYAKVAGNGIDSTQVFFLRDTTSVLNSYVKKDSLARYLNNSSGYDTAQMLSGYMRKATFVSSVHFDSLNGVYGTVKNPSSSPSISISLGNISPISITSSKGVFDTLNGTLLTAAQPNITSIGQLSGLSVSGTISAANFSGSLSTGTLQGITSLGNLSAITVSGNITSNTFSAAGGSIGNLTVPGTMTVGTLNATNANLSSLSGLQALTVTGNITANTVTAPAATFINLSVPTTITTGTISSSNATITNLSGLQALTVTGNIAANTVTAPTATITNLSVPATITAGTVSSSNATITSLSGLQELTVTGNIAANTINAPAATITNLTVPATITAGTMSSANATITSLSGLQALTVTGNIAANTINAPAATITNLTVPATITAGTVSSSNATITSLSGLQELTVTGNIAATTVSSSGATIGNLSVPGTITAGTLSGVFSGTLSNPAQPTITSVGQLTALSVNGTITAGLLSGVLSAGTQTNITSVGSLALLTVTGNISSATISSVITTAAQPNITSVGNLSNLSVAGTIQANTISTTQVNTSGLAGLQNLTVTGSINAATISVSGTISAATVSATNATLTNITGLSLPSGTLTDTFVTISGGVLKQTAYEPTFAADFVVNGVANYLKWTNGETVPARGKTAIQLLQEGAVKANHPTYTSPSLSIGTSPSAGNVEIGSSITATLSSTFTQNDAGAATTTTYKKNGTAIGSNTDNITNITSAVQYVVTVAYAQGACKNDNLGALDCTGRIAAGTITSSAVTYTPLPKRYWGYVNSTSPNDADIINAIGGGAELSSSKAKSAFNVTIPGSANYLVFAYPSSLGTLTSILAGGFESIGTFTLTTRTFTNASGYSQSYHIYVSNNSFSSATVSLTTN